MIVSGFGPGFLKPAAWGILQGDGFASPRNGRPWHHLLAGSAWIQNIRCARRLATIGERHPPSPWAANSSTRDSNSAPIQIHSVASATPQGTAKVQLPRLRLGLRCRTSVYTAPPSPQITIGFRSSFGHEQQNGRWLGLQQDEFARTLPYMAGRPQPPAPLEGNDVCGERPIDSRIASLPGKRHGMARSARPAGRTARCSANGRGV